MYIYQLTHTYSSTLVKSQFHAIETDLDWDSINFLCAYLQLVRDTLPDWQYSLDESATEEEMLWMLDQHYGIKTVAVDSLGSRNIIELNLFDNWNAYVCEKYSADAVNKYAIPDADVEFLKAIKRSVTKYQDGLKKIEVLEKLLAGEECVGVVNIYGDPISRAFTPKNKLFLIQL